MYRKFGFIVVTFLLLCQLVIAQYKYAPTNFPPKEFHKERRELLRNKLPKNSVAVFFANPIRNRANDVDYVYHQNPDLYYLTGYREPNAVLLLFSTPYQLEDGNTCSELLFVEERDSIDQIWIGASLTIKEVNQKLGVENVLPITAFSKFNFKFETFDNVLTYDPPRDVRNNIYNPFDLYDIIQNFKQKTAYPPFLNPASAYLYNLMRSTTIENQMIIAQDVALELRNTAVLRLDKNIINFISAASPEQRVKVAQHLPNTNIDIITLDSLMKDLREIKAPVEIKLTTKAIKISAIAQIEVMKAMKPGMSETEIQGIHEFIFKKYGAEYEGYPSIVGAGENGCMLHYIANNKPNVEDGELILMDCGAEYRGYTADVTRTIPVNGKFSKEQRTLYELVLKAQEKSIAACKEGASFDEVYTISTDIIGKGLYKLKIIDFPEDYARYFPHGLMHHIGLDVHDKGHYTTLKKDMIVTVEPGIYIPEGSECDEKWWGIGIRIEDDILITDAEPINLSARAPRSIEKIEAIMKETSIFDQLDLPILK
ncbi:aminopeptidase P family protein [Flammeovirga kamogawensis]|uniref:Xaa-Pro aminopeptidase n=1 Tax=Flammeovirga kamogawensis TaxID=373891 RepID=A0ABX8GV94_9BACT|nr:aminopeptidase P family protein [Flammeovirga kamogawensis]MBB6459707.1 Xaa-Pro aminopeptidase [Flammeovirga kamogawensis]QWG07232.1 aminopeptidase P N-terminal domain-containing protein [Flammeovirga kamogawensis]TRX69051.1 M24 family metallopeptidase [Flammeovirga kamogawensis]